MDVILRGGQVIDGTGAKAIRADVGVEGDTIVAIGDLSAAQAARVVDTAGLVVAPGFIDMHSHSDRVYPVDPMADSMIRQGVTTEVVGQCGGSAAPVRARDKEEFDRRWSAASAYPLRRHDLQWSTFGEYLEVVKEGGLVENIVPLVGHGSIRSYVMGSRPDPPDDDEIQLMREMVRSSMKDGAWGMSTGLIYLPGIYAKTDEIVTLAKVAAENNGFYYSHIRGESETLLEAIEEAITVGRSAGIPVQIAHFKAFGRSNWPKAAPALKLIEEAQAEGLDVTADIYPYLGGFTNLTSLTLPLWARGGGPLGALGKPMEPGVRRRLIDEVRAGMEADGRRWDEVYVARCPAKPEYEGRTILQLAEETGEDPVEAALRVHVEGEGRVSAIFMGMSEENVQLGLSHPSLMIGTDGYDLKATGPLGVGKLHPRSYGTFPRVLGHYARDLGLLTMEQAVNKMTGLTAKKLGLKDRGRLAVGYKADITVFNPQTIIDTATYAEPYSYPKGIEYVMVNGKLAVEGGEFIGRQAGKVLSR